MELSPTAYVALGMLNLGARTGYDIKSAVDSSTRFFWNASYAQIYPELKQLEKLGLVTGRLAPTGGRKRKEYELTNAGRKALVEWASGPAEMPVLRDEGLLKLFFADALTREEMVEQLRRRRVQNEGFLALLRQIEERAAQSPELVSLVLNYGIEYAEFNIEWCKRQERRLREREAA
jgi:DNA-binding PadR family transcriptional regulator